MTKTNSYIEDNLTGLSLLCSGQRPQQLHGQLAFSLLAHEMELTCYPALTM